jgi:antitoxin component HigA of HigAB toxin-antitoxin module
MSLSFPQTPLTPAEIDILLRLHRMTVTDLADEIEENRSVVSQVLNGERTTGKSVARIKQKVRERLALRPDLLAA